MHRGEEKKVKINHWAQLDIIVLFYGDKEFCLVEHLVDKEEERFVTKPQF